MIAPVQLPPNEILRSIFRERAALDRTGRSHAIRDEISIVHASALYRTVLANRPRAVIEVGMAFGISTLAILTALEEAGGEGRLISIDPNQTGEYHGVGLASVERAGLSHRHELVESPSYLALPDLLARNQRIQFAYIDGWHTFDYALLDFFYLDKMTPMGGIIAFNDCGWRAVHRATRFVLSHRSYEELDVGLKRDYRARNFAFSLIRRLEGRNGADRYFRKSSSNEPNWNFYARF
jgi:predicted O-methyltransferase YrrM